MSHGNRQYGGRADGGRRAGGHTHAGGFRDREAAGLALAARLSRYAGRRDALVLALPRGGVPVAAAVAGRLGIGLDVLVVRKLGMPRHPEWAMGAVGSGGVRVLQPGIPGLMGTTVADVEAACARELAELERRERVYRGGRAPLDLAGRTVILVDDGVATGSTGLAAIAVARRLGPRALVLAVPVAPPETLAELAPRVDELVCIAAPSAFGAVGRWYEEFDQTSDAQVQELLAAAWHAEDAGPAAKDDNQPTGGAKHEPDEQDRDDERKQY